MSPTQLDVLLVDDNPDDLFLIREAFRDSENFNIIGSYSSGDSAIQFLRESDELPSLILMDVNMPRKTGLEVLAELKSDEKLRQIPVVMLTTSSRPSDITQSYSSGAVSFLTKPVDFADFQKLASGFSKYWGQIARLPSFQSG